MCLCVYVCVCLCVETTGFYNPEKLSIDRMGCERSENILILLALLCFTFLNC